MSYKVDGTSITLTRGDTLRVKINPLMYGTTDEVYIPQEGDEIRFAMKKSYSDDEEVLILKDIPIDTCVLHLYPEQTKSLAYGKYVYDVQLTYADGAVDTFVKGTFSITEEVE